MGITGAGGDGDGDGGERDIAGVVVEVVASTFTAPFSSTATPALLGINTNKQLRAVMDSGTLALLFLVKAGQEPQR